MESVILATPHPYKDEFKARLERIWKISDTAYGGLFIEDDDSRVYIELDETVMSTFDPHDLARITGVLPEPIFYSVDFRGIELCRRVLFAIADDPHIMVDNDHGVLLPGTDFIRLLRSRPDWDWRRDIPRDVQS